MLRESSQNTTRMPRDGALNGANPSFKSAAMGHVLSRGHPPQPLAGRVKAGRDPQRTPRMLKVHTAVTGSKWRPTPAVPDGGSRMGGVRHCQLRNPTPLQPLNHSGLNFNSFALGRPFCRVISPTCLEWESRVTGIFRICRSRMAGDALRDGIDGGGRSKSPVSGPRPAW